ncbi:MAG: hypothetical protein ACJA04_000210 [Cellvibrionaceae bacterium]|jgi:uncharacterized protein YheU (UPF0270 family)
MIIPTERISDDALQNLIEAYITREGTDYGLQEWSLDAKVTQVKQQLAQGKVVVVYDPLSESTSLVTREYYSRYLQPQAALQTDRPDRLE